MRRSGDLDGLIASLADLREREASKIDAEPARRCARWSAIPRSRRRPSVWTLIGAATCVASSRSSIRAAPRRSRRRSRPRRERSRSSSARSRPATWSRSRNLEEWKAAAASSCSAEAIRRISLGALREFAEKQAESVQDAQREQFATLTLNTAVDLTAAALGRIEVEGPSDAQAIALRDAMRVLFPEAVALVSAARQGFMRQS